MVVRKSLLSRWPSGVINVFLALTSHGEQFAYDRNLSNDEHCDYKNCQPDVVPSNVYISWQEISKISKNPDVFVKNVLFVK